MSVLITDLYYGHTCECCGGFENAARQSVVFSPEALAKGLEAIYKGLNVRDEIEDHIFRETLRLFNEAASKGISESKWPDVPDEFINQLRTNNAIWSAFRVHRMQNDIASQLIDENGQLKKFDRWVEDIKGMTNHYVGPWLRTEYNTAVIRAHQAADWKHFEAEADVFQNVRWMPTTSPQQDPLHRQYWEKKLTLPINHPFWEKHRPGDRWNCKCTLQQTDEPVNDEVIKDFYPVPQEPGLDNNPGKDGKLFSNTHPYISKAYPGAKAAVEDILDEVLDFVPAQTIEEAEKFAKQYCQKLGIDRTFKGEVSYKGISVDIANEINRTLQQIFNTVDIPKISGIKPISGSSKTGQKVFSSSDAIAAYDPVSKGIYLNTDVLKSAKAFAEYQKRAQAAWDKVMANLDKLSPAQREIAERYKKSGRELVDDSIKGCIIHEFGHHVQWTKMPASLVNSLTKIAEHSVKISGYAGTTKSEYIAESFASWMKGENKIEKSLQDFFDSIATTKPKKKVITKRQKTDQEKQEIRRRWEVRRLRAQLPDNLTNAEKDAIAANNYELQQAMKITAGKPMTVEQADKQNANPAYVPKYLIDPAGPYRDAHNRYRLNPNYVQKRDQPNSINCQTCAPAYALRLKGFDVTAKPNTKGSKLEYLSKGKAFEVWKTPDGTPAQHNSLLDWMAKKGYKQMNPNRYLEFFEEACQDVGVYELSIGWRGGGGHATILQRFPDGTLRYIEPQEDNSAGAGYEFKDVGYLANSGATSAARIHACRGILRIDNKLFDPSFVDIFNK